MSARASALIGCFIGCLLLVASPLRAQTSRVATDGIQLPDRSVTTQSDAASVEVNPAGLGFIESTETRYTLDLDTTAGDGLTARAQHGFFLGTGNDWIGAGVGFQWLDRSVLGSDPQSYQKYSLALALRPGSNLSLGGGLHFYGSSFNRRLNDLSSLDFGAQWRPSKVVGIGLNFRDTNHPFLRVDRALPVRIQPGAALRLVDGRIILDNQLSWAPREDRLTYSPRVDVMPLDGLRLFGRAGLPLTDAFATDDERATRFIGGLEVSLGEVGVASAASFRSGAGGDGGSYTGQTQSIWLTPQSRPSLLQPSNRWVRVKLDDDIAERATDPPFGSSRRGFLDIMLHTRELADDPSIDGVLFEIDNHTLGYGQTWELRQQIRHLREAGKQTAAYLKDPSFAGVYLASAADKVYLMPAEPYSPEGVRVSLLNYAEALSKIGINAEFLRIGDYKSAPESFVQRQPSEEAIEQTTAFVDEIFGEVVSSIADDRGVSHEEVEEAIDEIPMLPDRAVGREFVDNVFYPDEIRPHLKEQLGAGSVLGTGYDPNPAPVQGWDGGPKVAVLYIDGNIVQGKSSNPPLFGEMLTGSETIIRVLEQLGRDSNVHAIVVRIDSPGGSAVASDLIFRAMRRVAQVKPVVTSMGDVAASGGYYTAAGADTIFATPNTLTGSVGIFSGKFSIGRLADLLGVNHTEIQRGNRAGQFEMFEPWSNDQRRRVSKSIHYLYRLFLEQTAKTRPLSPDEIDEVARGRVWVAEAAKDAKLVDRLGGLVDAIHYAEKQAGLEPGTAEYETYPKPGSFLELSPTGVGVLGKIASAFGGESGATSKSERVVDGFLSQLVDRLQQSVLLPLLYESGEPLMLPPQAIVVEP